MAVSAATEEASEDYLGSTFFMDYEGTPVASFAQRVCQGKESDRDKAVALFYAVRDDIRYDAYRVEFSREGLRASRALSDGYGFCISKAALLSAAARSQGIPARLGFGDVRNHLTTEKLRKQMKTDIFMFHGYSELWLEDRWVKATPAFNLALCEKFGVLPLDFDGQTDCLFHPFAADGSKHMEYVRDRGSFADIPYDLIRATWDSGMQGDVDEFNKNLEGDFAEDGARERTAAPK